MSNEADSDVDEKADEADVFIPQQEDDKVKRPTGLRSLVTFITARFSSPRARNASSAHLLEEQQD